MRIAVVSQYFTPEPAKIPVGVAQGLASRGHSVRVVTGYPNYPTGRLYEGFRRRLVHYERHGSVLVRRVPMVIGHSANPVGRFANYASFALGSLMTRRFVQDADVVYVYATQMTAALAPQYWRRSIGIPYVLHVQDLWPESVAHSSLIPGFAQGLVIRGMSRWLELAYRRASAVIAIAPTMARRLAERGADPKHVETVLNWADEAFVQPRQQNLAHRAGLVVVYAGSLGDVQNLETAIDAARLVADELSEFRLVIVGGGIAESRLKKAAAGLNNVEFRGRVSIEEMDGVYAESDFQLIILRDLPFLRGTIPSKLQGSLAAGVPVISAVAGDLGALVDAEGVGLTAEPDNPESLAEAFRRAYAMPLRSRLEMGERARRTYVETMSFEKGIDRIEQVLKRAACARVGGPA